MKVGMTITAFDLLGRVNTMPKRRTASRLAGIDYNAIALDPRSTSLIGSESTHLIDPRTVAFQPREKELELKGSQIPERLEHLLRMIRESYPGITFQFIELEYRSINTLIIRKLPMVGQQFCSGPFV